MLETSDPAKIRHPIVSPSWTSRGRSRSLPCRQAGHSVNTFHSQGLVSRDQQSSHWDEAKALWTLFWLRSGVGLWGSPGAKPKVMGIS